MRYRIDECVICGVINPQLVIRGWVENEADKIVIKSKNKKINEKIIKKVRSKVSTFHFIIPLDKNKKVYEIYFTNHTDEKLIEKLNTNIFKRIIQKYYPKGYFKGKIKSRKIRKEIEEYSKGTLDMKNPDDYNKWLKTHESFVPVQDYEYKPKISIVMPVYNVPGEYLGYCLDSVLNQTYQNFEICIADDCSTNQDTIDTLHKYMNKDKRIKVIFRKENGHISRATNSALELVTGEFVGLMDNDDKLEMHALNEVVHVLNQDKTWDFIYTDEDKVDMEGNRSDPHFKSDFAIDTLYGGNYICHFSVIRKTLIDKIGGFRVGYEGAQDFDLFLRLTEVTDRIYHIPKVLYHWRMIPGSTAVGGDGAKNYAGEAGKRALEDYFANKNIKVNVDNFISTNYFVEYVLDEEKKVEIIIDATNNSNNINKCIKTIQDNLSYKNYTINIIGMVDIEDEKNVRFHKISEERLINYINDFVTQMKDCFIAFVDINTCHVSCDSLDIMVGYAKQNNVGYVCGKIHDKFNIIRKTGIIYNEQTLLDGYLPTYSNDYGAYGRLIIPHDFSIINPYFCLIDVNKFILFDNNCKDLKKCIMKSSLELTQKKYNNIFIPQVDIMNSELDKRNNYSNEFFNLIEKEDKFYNKNLSKTKPFRLDDITKKGE